MACSIKITSVTGKRLPNQTDPSSILVVGTAQDCAQIKVELTCLYQVGAGVESGSYSGTATVHSTGDWSLEFLQTQIIHCKCAGSVSVRAWCVDNPACNVEGSFVLPCIVQTDCPYVEDINIIIDVPKEPPCVDQQNSLVDVTLTAQGPFGPGNYKWQFTNGGTSFTAGGSGATSITQKLRFPGSYTVELVYTPSKAGCPPSSPPSKVINVPLCPPPPNGGEHDDDSGKPPPPDKVVIEKDDTNSTGGSGGGGSAGCDALLWGAIGTALLGAGLFAGGVCAQAPFVWQIGLALAMLGVGLFFLWWAVCGKISSCGVMQAVHCMLFWMAIATPVVALGVVGITAVSAALGYQSGPAFSPKNLPCLAAIAAFWGWVGTLYALLTWAMKSANCPTKCP